MRTLILSLLLALFFAPTNLLAKKKIPCLKKNSRGKWIPQKGTTCIEFSVEDLRDNNKKLLKLQWFQKTFEPNAKINRSLYQKLDGQWKRSQALWKREQILQNKILTEYKGQADTWKKAWFKLKDVKQPPKHWSDSKALWLSVGLVVGVGVTVGVTAIVLTAQKSP